MRKALLPARCALDGCPAGCCGFAVQEFFSAFELSTWAPTKNVLTMNYFLRGDNTSNPKQIVNFDTGIIGKVRHIQA